MTPSPGASNLAATSDELLALVEERRAAVAEEEGVDPAEVPPDAVTASASGLDPHISPEYARLQVERVAAERGMPVDLVRELVDSQAEGRDLGFLGEPGERSAAQYRPRRSRGLTRDTGIWRADGCGSTSGRHPA